MFFKRWWFSKQACLSTNTLYIKPKNGKSTDYVLSWKSNGLFNSRRKPFYTAFLHSIKLSGYRRKISLAVEKSNYLTITVNVCIVYELNAWPRNPFSSFKYTDCLLGATNIVKNRDKERYVYSRYKITFASGGKMNFDNDTAINVIIFGVVNSSSCHLKNNILMLDKRPPFGINESFGAPEKKLDTNFSNAKTKICLNLNSNGDDIYLFVNGKEALSWQYL